MVFLFMVGGASAQQDRKPAPSTKAPASKGTKGEATKSEALNRPDVWYMESVAQSDMAGFQVAHHWSKGSKFRFETVVDGHPVINIVNGERYYAFDPFEGEGIVIRRSRKAVAQDRRRGRPFGNDHIRLVKEGGEFVREEVLFGKNCKVYRLTNDRGKREIWVDKKTDLPIRSILFSRATKTESYTDYIGWARDQRYVPDSFFVPDPRIKFAKIQYEAFSKYSEGGTMVPILFPHLIHGN